MKRRTLEDWIKIYEQKTNSKYEPPDSRTTRHFFSDRGFAEIGFFDNMLIVGQICGDGGFWKQVTEILAAERGITHGGCWIVRDPELYFKAFNIEIEKTEENEEGFKRYFCKFKDNGKKVLVTPQGRLKNGNIRYIVTWEI